MISRPALPDWRGNCSRHFWCDRRLSHSERVAANYIRFADIRPSVIEKGREILRGNNEIKHGMSTRLVIIVPWKKKIYFLLHRQRLTAQQGPVVCAHELAARRPVD